MDAGVSQRAKRQRTALGSGSGLLAGFGYRLRLGCFAGCMVVVMSCMNTMMMGQRQDDDDRAERLSMAIEARSVELMQHGEACDPLDGFNVVEAMNEASDNVKIVLAKVLSERKFDQVGLLIDMTSRDFWAKKAIEMAEEELS
jgi:hypothetical protein